jgi:RimJ/RimL family protein N-acetyltransferase
MEPGADGELVTLRDGSRALVRPIRPEDRWRIAEGLKLLSTRTKYLRFHADIEAFTEEQLTYLTEVDHRDHEAWVAIAADDPDAPGLGVARYVRLESDPTVAEAAVTVVDEFQGRGIGTILLRRLAASAIENGIRTFRNYVLAENEAMLEVFDLIGAARQEIEPGLLQVDVALPDDPDLLPVPGLSELVRELARGLIPQILWRFPWSAKARGGPSERVRRASRAEAHGGEDDTRRGEDDTRGGEDDTRGGDDDVVPPAGAPAARLLRPPYP